MTNCAKICPQLSTNYRPPDTPQLRTCPQLRTLFNTMYILELLDLSYYRSQRRFPHHLKGISSQGCWMILIGCRTYGDWKAGGWVFFDFLVLKKGGLWRFLRRICNQATLSLRSMSNTPNTADTYDSDTDTPFPTDTYVSSFSGSGIGWFDNGYFPIDIAIYWLLHWFIKRESGRQRPVSKYVHWQVKEVSTSSSIDYLKNLSTDTQICLLTDKNWRWWVRAVSISNTIHQY